MKGKDNGTNASSTKEQLNLSSFPQEIEEQLNLLNGNILNNQIKLKSIEDSPGDYSIVTSKDKAKQTNEPDNEDMKMSKEEFYKLLKEKENKMKTGAFSSESRNNSYEEDNVKISDLNNIDIEDNNNEKKKNNKNKNSLIQKKI